MFIRYSELLTGQMGRSRMDMSDSHLTYSIHKRTRNGGATHSISLRMSLKICKMAKIFIGDRLEFLFDLENDAGRIEKSTYGGHRLCKSGEHGAIIRMPYIPSSKLPFVDHPIAMERVEAVNDGIEFHFPAHLSKGRGMAAATAESEDKS